MRKALRIKYNADQVDCLFGNAGGINPAGFLSQLVLIISFLGLMGSCKEKAKPLFSILPPESTGLYFNNEVSDDEYFNILTNEYIYNGAGVGIGDFNHDGLMDVYFCGGMVSNRLYLNRGELRFEDVTRYAGIGAEDIWSTGVSVVDINGDGWDDLYVCASNNADSLLRRNKLYIHKGLDENGIPHFSEEAGKYGIDDSGFSSHGAFFDFDHDNDLDLYVLTNVLYTPSPNTYREKNLNGTAPNNDRFYRNNGDGTFADYSREAGITHEGYGLGISIVDINQDGYSDIYITNDYLTNDLLYINNRDGTFTNRIGSYIKHQTHSAMGHNVADVNNDALPDIFTLDMLPESNQLLKQMHGTSRYENDLQNREFGYEPQYKRNMLQINNGEDNSGNHNFSEIGLYAGIYATDWSWSALFADYDNDGNRDLFISNGYPKDVTDLDYATSGLTRGMAMSQEEILMTIPERHHSNYIFRNNGDLTFSNLTKEWGIFRLSFSNGGSYADFDNDGDLDIILSNINEPAMFYENLLIRNGKTPESGNSLRIRLVGSDEMKSVTGSKVYLYYGEGKMLFEDYSVFHGFLSNREPAVHFGVGKYSRTDSLVVIWPDGKRSVLYQLSAGQEVEVRHEDASENPATNEYPRTKIYPDSNEYPEEEDKEYSPSSYPFREVTSVYHLDHLHREEAFNDFNIQPAIPRQFSQAGPAMAAADLNGDNKADLIIAGAAGKNGKIFFNSDSGFLGVDFEKINPEKEEQGLLLFDADLDGDQDLYMAFGGYEKPFNPFYYQDELYMNDGHGNFLPVREALPSMEISSGCVRACDYDLDGDLDLFVGGRVMPGKYPEPVSSYILRNDSGPGKVSFSDVTAEICPELTSFGMVNDALWTDFNNDGKIDLVLAGEWMPVTFFARQQDKLINVTEETGLMGFSGWWNSISGGDFDNDGDIDYVVGNLGLNSVFKASPEKPVRAYSADFDNNGRHDVILTGYFPDKDGGTKEFPVHFRSDMGRQMEGLRNRFTTYEAYSEATIDSLLTPEEFELARIYTATCFESVYLENRGEGRFRIMKLPWQAQLAPLYGMLTGDFNGDQLLDVLVIGNDYGQNQFWGNIDALNGLLLTGRGNGEFDTGNYPETGFFVPGDGKSLVGLPLDNNKLLVLASQNRDSLKAFETSHPAGIIRLPEGAGWALIQMEDGKSRKQEFYYGQGYFSQSDRYLILPPGTSGYEFFGYSGERMD